ncbi:NADPH oxidase 4 [Rhizophlyctis rosea]|uniref:NADPH oxidase 4 n=1 Tax=Rhizophlyctis rosea TaxID=64517 RepID=A0AAD5SHU4_9FUNG|nr:NADPH oxidase 4 [Rhizophlyctis rosea]
MCTHGMWGFFESFVHRDIAWYTGLRCWHVTAPGLIVYLLDFIYGMIAVRTWAKCEVIAAKEYDCGIMEVTFKSRRPGRAKKGRYIRIRCPSVSLYETHPFTLTTDPSKSDHWTLHISVSGDWTRKFRDALIKSNGNYPDVMVEGPFGAPTEDIKRWDHVICVAAGIGVTPFIPLLRSLADPTAPGPRKIALHWVYRDLRIYNVFEPYIQAILSERVELTFHYSGKVDQKALALITRMLRDHHTVKYVDNGDSPRAPPPGTMPMVNRVPSTETLDTLVSKSPENAYLSSSPQSANLPRHNSNASQSTTGSGYNRGRLNSDAPLMTPTQFGKEAHRNASTATNATAINFSPNTRFRSDSESSASPYGSSVPYGQSPTYDPVGYLNPVKGGKDAFRSPSETSTKTFVSFSGNRNTFLADDDFLAMYATPLQDLESAYTPSQQLGGQGVNYSQQSPPQPPPRDEKSGLHPHGFVTTHFSTNTPSLTRTTSKRTRARMGVGFHIETTRPDFQKILERALSRWPEAREVGVFLCGAKAISVQLHKACTVVTANERKSRGHDGVLFYYNKETF